MQDAWAAIGVDATPRSLEFSALIEATTTTPTFEIALYGFSWDATFIQDAMFGCDQYQVGFNDMKYCNPALDEINDEAKRTFDEDARRELLIQAQNIVNDEQPIAVLDFSQGHAAFNDALQNYDPNAWGVDLNVRLDSAVGDRVEGVQVMGCGSTAGRTRPIARMHNPAHHPTTPSASLMYTVPTRPQLRASSCPFIR